MVVLAGESMELTLLHQNSDVILVLATALCPAFDTLECFL